MKVAFVILHYLTIEDTRECINSILENISYRDYEIIIVDNGSTNDSGRILHEEYDFKLNVHILDSIENLGFAKGNNLGYAYAKKVLNSDLIIMINNDTIINHNNFIEEVIKIYYEHKFDILGPDIISTIDNKHQNPYEPFRKSNMNEKSVKNLILKYNIFILLNYLYLDQILKSLFKIVSKKKPSSYNNEENYKYLQSGIRLHGSCLIFSPDYIKKYKGLYDKTFLYMEEDILFYIAWKERLKVLYSPNIEILHKEDSSTNALFNNKIKKRRFIYKNIRISAKELLKILKDDKVYQTNMKD